MSSNRLVELQLLYPIKGHINVVQSEKLEILDADQTVYPVVHEHHAHFVYWDLKDEEWSFDKEILDPYPSLVSSTMKIQ